jgi:hypothetical protein
VLLTPHLSLSLSLSLSNCRNDDGDEEDRSRLSRTTAHCPPSSDFIYFLFFIFLASSRKFDKYAFGTNK